MGCKPNVAMQDLTLSFDRRETGGAPEASGYWIALDSAEKGFYAGMYVQRCPKIVEVGGCWAAPTTVKVRCDSCSEG